jgi:pyruvate dehydrogenase E2 component (dihydrolipoamide acetyltransferase)
MPQDIKLPDLGEGIESADVVGVLVSQGDTIEKEQSILEIETDKATVEVPSPAGGTVAEIKVESGQSVSVGDVLMTLEEGGGEEESSDSKQQTQEKPEKKQQKEDEEKQKPGEEQESKPQQDDSQEDQASETQAEEAEGQASEKPQAEAEQRSESEGKAEKSQPGTVTTESDRSAAGRPDQLIPAGPAVRRMAREMGVDLQKVQGSGPGGRIDREDLLSAVRQLTQAPGGQTLPAGEKAPGEPDAGKWGPIRREKLSKVRRTIAEKMHESASTIPHVAHFDEVDVTELDAFRKNHKEELAKQDVRLTMMPFVIRAIATALRNQPVVNASIDLESGEIIYHDYISIGIAVDTERGLVVPVLRNADRLSIAQIASGVSELAEKARNNDYEIDDLRGGTFTISNVGAIGGWFSTPIINKPESAIMLLGRSKRKPVVLDDGQIEPRLIMPLSLSYDHRLIDGANAARFMNEVAAQLSCPGLLLLTA